MHHSYYPLPILRRARRAFSIVEAVVSIVVVGVMLVAALAAAGASRRGLLETQDRRRSALLAQQLMSEILEQSYEEPVDTPTFGRESGESGGDRANYDDVDDYHGWSASPPESKDGTQITGLDGWGRSVAVEWVSQANLLQKAVSDTGIKRVTVTVTRDGVEVASMVAIRTGAVGLFAIDPQPPIFAGGG